MPNHKGKQNKSKKPRRKPTNSLQVSTVPYRINNAPLYKVSRTCEVSTPFWTSTTAAAGIYAYSFQLSQVGDVTSFTGIFDQYMIERIDVMIRPTSNLATPSTTLSFAILAVAVDYDDDTTPANLQEVLNYDNAVVLTPARGRTISFRPTFRGGAVDGTETLQGASTRRGWIDCSYTTIKHYGLKAAVRQSTSTNQTSWYFSFRYHLVFRASR